MSQSTSTENFEKYEFNSVDEFDMLLGRSIRYFQQLEQAAEIRLCQLASASSVPEGHLPKFLGVAVAEVSFRTKLRLLETLLSQLTHRTEYKVCQEDPQKQASLEREMERARTVLTRLKKLEEERNRYVHSFWLALGPLAGSIEPVTVTRIKTRATPKKTLTFDNFSIQEFLSFLKEALDVQQELAQSTGRLLGLLNYDKKNI